MSPVHNAHVCVFDSNNYKMMRNDIGVAVTLFILNKKCSMNPFFPVQLNKENPISECMERNGTKQNYSA